MSDEPFMDVIVQTVLFLELSDAQTVDEDAAVAMLEQIAATLQRLDSSEKGRFLRHIQLRASRATTAEERETIEGMVSNLGLVSE